MRSRTSGRHPQIVGLLCGHVHWLVAREWAGTQARIIPSIAVDVRKGVDEVEARGRPMYFLHETSADGRLVSRARWADTGSKADPRFVARAD